MRFACLALLILGCGHSAGGNPDMLGDGGSSGDGGCVDLPLPGATQSASGQCSDFTPLRNVYWGDLHDHSYFSLDAYGFGNRRSPLDAYNYAMGQCASVNGVPTQIDRPLDFVIVSDHSEYIGATDECFNLDGTGWSGQSTAYCQAVQATAAKPWPQSDLVAAGYFAACGCAFANDACVQMKLPAIESSDATTYGNATQSVWQLEVKTANDVYNSHLCQFTTLPAYEWTAAPSGNTMHHIVVFANENVPAQPLDYLHYDDESKLLSGLQSQCTGSCDVITMQHNMNLSGGQAWLNAGTAALDALRANYERLVEIHQEKGSSECTTDPADGNDPLCDFEYRVNDAMQTLAQVAPGYARPGLAKGLADWSTNKRNAYQFGFVGATDNHQSTPGQVRESTWIGAVANVDNTPTSRLTHDQKATGVSNPGGITGVWAPQNLRPDIFAALKRRETFATSGPRIALRFYQTWDQTTDFCTDPNFPSLIEKDIAQNGGAIMGSTVVPAKTAGTKPRFVVFALRDPATDPTNDAPVDLGQAQLIKGVYDATAAKTTVTLQTQTVQSPPLPHESGAALCHTFSDDNFDATKPTYYYPRVLQQPTWRWSHYDCQSASGASTCDAATQDVKIQERAWGSPVWFLP